MAEGLRQVGSPNTTLKNSPICDIREGKLPEFDTSEGTPSSTEVCYFNGEAIPKGSEVASGDKILRCNRGSWVAMTSDQVARH